MLVLSIKHGNSSVKKKQQKYRFGQQKWDKLTMMRVETPSHAGIHQQWGEEP
jgi:hypothetical protein